MSSRKPVDNKRVILISSFAIGVTSGVLSVVLLGAVGALLWNWHNQDQIIMLILWAPPFLLLGAISGMMVGFPEALSGRRNYRLFAALGGFLVSISALVLFLLAFSSYFF